MTPRPSTRTEPPARLHERPPDPVEASATPLERKESADPHGGPTPRDPHHQLNHPAEDPDPTSDSDPYEREPEEPGEPQDPDADPEIKRAAQESLRPPGDE
jgi:hypothetical protein